jgi:ABC-type branched-subunit amino acid transport system ATPase component
VPGVSFETPNHFLKLTGLENLRYFAALYSHPTRCAEGLLKAVGLWEDGDRPVGHYSRGMKCRLGVARALLCDPELLFLDEPTSGLGEAPGEQAPIPEHLQGAGHARAVLPAPSDGSRGSHGISGKTIRSPALTSWRRWRDQGFDA